MEKYLETRYFKNSLQPTIFSTGKPRHTNTLSPYHLCCYKRLARELTSDTSIPWSCSRRAATSRVSATPRSRRTPCRSLRTGRGARGRVRTASAASGGPRVETPSQNTTAKPQLLSGSRRRSVANYYYSIDEYISRIFE